MIDVGGRTSPLAGALLERGVADVSVLEVSELALRTSRERLGPRSARVHWILADVLGWLPERSYGVWHDRAVLLHFLVEPEGRERYCATARDAVAPGGRLVIGGFAEDGPETCSGLPVARRTAAALAAEFAPGFALVAERRQEHRTAAGTAQAFTWVALRRTAA